MAKEVTIINAPRIASIKNNTAKAFKLEYLLEPIDGMARIGKTERAMKTTRSWT